jgi:Zn-dependent peptidase ImmA (M78 family)/DNA-binding XRE family transcriptional regulator
MPTTSEAHVNPAVLRWARARARTTPEIIAKKIGTKVEKVSAWEAGNKHPTFRQAMAIADTLRVPFGYLFLPNPPDEQIPMADYRTIRHNEPATPSPDFIDLLYDVAAKQLWYRELLESEEQEELLFVGSFRPQDEGDHIANNISEFFEITDDFRNASANWEEFLKAFIARVEDRRILVMRSGIVGNNQHRRISEKEFRGFTISDRLAPLIFINSTDSVAAQIFTLAHELGHLWMGQTGISNESLIEFADNEIETKCNAIAAEVLVPKVAFIERWNENDELMANVDRLVHHFRVSSLVMLRRARELRLTSEQAFRAGYSAEEARLKALFKRRHEKPGGSFYNTLFARNSRTFTEAVIEAVRTERVLYSEAASLLNVHVPTVTKIADQLAKSEAAG